jgi:hypothetical protein
VAEAIGTGDLKARAADSGGDEVSALAQAFNRMAAELESVQDQNRGLNEQLLNLQERERAELASQPALERAELAEIYVKRGVHSGLAFQVAQGGQRGPRQEVLEDPQVPWLLWALLALMPWVQYLTVRLKLTLVYSNRCGFSKPSKQQGQSRILRQ